MTARWAALIAIVALAPPSVSALAAEIDGQIAFPGRDVPPMIAYAYEIDAARLRSLRVGEARSKFALHLPPGRYLVFLAPSEPGAPNIYGAYTEHSACHAHAAEAQKVLGATPAVPGACDDHRLATIHLTATSRTAAVKIDDWYLSDATSAELDHIRGLAAAPDQGPIGAPRFSEYAIAVPQAASLSKADVSEMPTNAVERRAIEQSLAKGPNFAGQVTVIGTRCGEGCEHLLLLDWRSGKISRPPALNAIRESLPCHSEDAVQFRRDSRLLSVTRRQDEAVLTEYYLWRPDSASLAPLAQYRRKVRQFCGVDPP